MPVRLTFRLGLSPPIRTAPVCGPPRFYIRRALLFYPSAPQDKDVHSLLYPCDLDGTLSARECSRSGTRDVGYLYVIRTSVSVSRLANNSTIAIVYLNTIWLREQNKKSINQLNVANCNEWLAVWQTALFKTLFTWSGGPRPCGVGFFCFHAMRETKQKKLTPLDRGPPLHVNRILFRG